MFGFGKKKPPPPPTREKRQRISGKTKEDYKDDLAKLGLLGIDADELDLHGGGSGSDSEPDEADLENELLAIIGEDSGSTDALLPDVNLKPMPIAAISPAVTPPDSNVESIFRAPPPPVTVREALDQRLEKYKSELDKATKANEPTSKLRRIGRIVKQYEDAITDHKKGRAVAFDELPTPPGYGPIPGTQQPQAAPVQEVTPRTNSAGSQPFLPPARPEESEVPLSQLASFTVPDEDIQSQPEVTPEEDSINIQPPAEVSAQNEQLNIILAKQKEFREAAFNAKKTGNMELAKDLLRISKGLETMVQTCQAGLPVDLTTLPSIETATLLSSETRHLKEKDELVSRSGEIETMSPVQPAQVQSTPKVDEVALGEANPAESIFEAPPAPTTVAEALNQRLEKYKSELEKANEANNSGKSRRMGRIVKQYEEAITAHKRGRPVAFDELPTPPGYGPIPTGIPAPSISAPAAVPGPSTPGMSPQPTTVAERVPGVSPGQSHGSTINRGINKPQTKLTLQEKQLQAILERQKKFKEAAFNAKKRGDIDQAKEFLRTAKGFDKLVQASEAGLPVDMATLPSPPEEVASLSMALETSDDFEIVRSGDCVPPPAGSAAEIFSKLEEDLREQLKMCMKTREHFKNMGDVASGNRFEKLALETKKDLDMLRLSMKQNGELPKYHYETRVFSITECNSELADDEIEISIIKGINYKVPNPTDVDTFIKIELPYPSAEEAQTNKTAVIRDTNNPDYDATFKMKINRTARPFQRFIHRHGVKLEVWSKGGFLRSSTLIGTATVKLLPLETKCTLHDAFDMLEGRRAVGKIEVKVRLREPVLTKQITQKKEKWLSIDRV